MDECTNGRCFVMMALEKVVAKEIEGFAASTEMSIKFRREAGKLEFMLVGGNVVGVGREKEVRMMSSGGFEGGSTGRKGKEGGEL